MIYFLVLPYPCELFVKNEPIKLFLAAETLAEPLIFSLIAQKVVDIVMRSDVELMSLHLKEK